jgi:hypothetical protein
MSKSVVLNFDKSIKLAKDFWQSLDSASSDFWHPSIALQNRRLSRFAQSLIYYNHESLASTENWAKICELAHDIRPYNKSRTFDHDTINKIIGLGVKLPPNTSLETGHFESVYVEKALEIIQLAWPAAYREMEEYMEGAIVIADENIQGQTAPTWFGAVFIGHPMIKTHNIRAIATSILHEVGHLVLFAQSSLVSPLHDPNQHFYSEFKQTQRPSIMVLHAQIALARMILWLFSLRQYVDRNPSLEETFPRAPLEKVLNRHVATYLRGMQHVRSMPYTESGFDILEDFMAIENLLRTQ